MLQHLKDDKRKLKLENIQTTNIWVTQGYRAKGGLDDHGAEKGFTLQGVPGQGEMRRGILSPQSGSVSLDSGTP